MPLNGKSWFLLVSLALGFGLGVVYMKGGKGAAEKRAAVAEGRALGAIERATGHERRADDLKAQTGALEAKLTAAELASASWRRQVEEAVVPGPTPVPQDPQVAAIGLRSVGLHSALALPDGVKLDLLDSGMVHDWGIQVPALRQQSIAQLSLIAGLDSQVGILSSQKTLLGSENVELRAANKELRVGADQFKVAYEQTDKALKIERRWGPLKVGAAAVIGVGAGYLIWHK
jgi:hypothetical protein